MQYRQILDKGGLPEGVKNGFDPADVITARPPAPRPQAEPPIGAAVDAETVAAGRLQWTKGSTRGTGLDQIQVSSDGRYQLNKGKGWNNKWTLHRRETDGTYSVIPGTFTNLREAKAAAEADRVAPISANAGLNAANLTGQQRPRAQAMAREGSPAGYTPPAQEPETLPEIEEALDNAVQAMRRESFPSTSEYVEAYGGGGGRTGEVKEGPPPRPNEPAPALPRRLSDEREELRRTRWSRFRNFARRRASKASVNGVRYMWDVVKRLNRYWRGPGRAAAG